MAETISDRVLRAAAKLRIENPIAVFFTAPVFMAAFIMAIGWVLVALDKALLRNGLGTWWWVPSIEQAVTFFSVVATSAMTALTLTYSLTLVAFTLAAGNIGPRLLQRFTTDITIQITAGVFGGTFLFALNAIFFTTPSFVPPVTSAVAFFLALYCVAQLIYFVREVASSVSIDDEISSIGETLQTDIDGLMERAGAVQFERTGEGTQLDATTDGYVGNIDVEALMECASKHDLRAELLVPVGHFLLEGTPILQISGQTPSGEIRDEVRGAFAITPTRTHAKTADFSINLLLEIALRALSPGVNDTYTAIACLDRLTSALRKPVARNLDARSFCDGDGTPRLFVPNLKADHLVRAVFRPIRDALSGNLLMADRTARALVRLGQIADPAVREILAEEARLLVKAVRRADVLGEDADRVEALLDDLLDGREAPRVTG